MKKFILLIFFMGITLQVCAHHSTSLYQQTEISIEGTISQFQWRNPHVYIWIEESVGDEIVTWEIEGQSPSMFRRVGWTKNMLTVGEKVRITGNPGRNDDQKIMLMGTIEKQDNVVIEMTLGKISEKFQQENINVTQQTESLNGTWLTKSPDIFSLFYNSSSYDLTDKGKSSVETYVDSIDNPSVNCIPIPAPGNVLWPSIVQIEINDEIIYLRSEYDSVERKIFMNVGTDSREDIQGHSIGHWENDTLVITTTNFSPHRTGNILLQLASGREKRLIERLELNEAGFQISYSFTLSDTEYFTNTINGTGQWLYQPENDFEQATCDIENARRFFE